MRNKLLPPVLLLLTLSGPALSQAVGNVVQLRHVTTETALSANTTVLRPNEPGVADDTHALYVGTASHVNVKIGPGAGGSGSVGPQGPVGPAGPAGSTGAAGAAGVAGTNGVGYTLGTAYQTAHMNSAGTAFVTDSAFTNDGTNVTVTGTLTAHKLTLATGVIAQDSAGQNLFATSSGTFYQYTGTGGLVVNNQANSASLWVLSNTGNATLTGTMQAGGYKSSDGTTGATGTGGGGDTIKNGLVTTLGSGYTLPSTGTAGTYSYPASLTTDAQGRVTGVTAGSAPTGVPLTKVFDVASASDSSSIVWGNGLNIVYADTTSGNMTVVLPALSLSLPSQAIRVMQTGGSNTLQVVGAPVPPSGLPGSPVVDSAGDSITGIASGALVTNWPDAGSGGNNWTNNSGTQTFSPSSLNGHAVVHFSGGSGGMLNATNLSASHTVCIVVRFAGTTSGLARVIDSTSTNYLLGYSSGQFTTFDSLFVSATTAQTSLSTWVILTAVGDGSSTHLYLNGAEVGTPSTASGPISLALSWTSGHNQPFTGDLAEVVCYNTALSNGVRAAMEQWLGGKYGIFVLGSAGQPIAGVTAPYAVSQPTEFTQDALSTWRVWKFGN